MQAKPKLIPQLDWRINFFDLLPFAIRKVKHLIVQNNITFVVNERNCGSVLDQLKFAMRFQPNYVHYVKSKIHII